MAIVFVPRGICNAYNEGAEKARKIMNKNDKRVIMNKVISVIAETIVTVLIVVVILILVAEDQIATAILAGLGLMSGIGMIINETCGISTWLDIISESNSDNK
jgi:predicted nucleic acid-binding Zn ribbon protein